MVLSAQSISFSYIIQQPYEIRETKNFLSFVLCADTTPIA